MWRNPVARLWNWNLSLFWNSGRRFVVKVPTCKMTSYSTVERGSPFSLDYRVYLSKFKDLGKVPVKGIPVASLGGLPSYRRLP